MRSSRASSACSYRAEGVVSPPLRLRNGYHRVVGGPSDSDPNDRTTHGFYAEAPVRRSDGPDNAVTSPRAEEPKLVQPERSPLAYVMGDETPNAVPRAERSHDSSRFVLGLIGDTPPPTVDSEIPVVQTMQPTLRRARLLRQRGAIAAIGVVGVAVAIKLATSAHAPRASAPEAKVAAAPVAPAPAPPPSNVVAEPPTPNAGSGSAAEPEPVAEPAPEEAAPPTPPPPVVVASAKSRHAPAKSSPSKKSKKAKPKSTAVAKKSSAAKKSAPTKKVTTAKKATTAGNARAPKKRSP